MKKRVKPSSPSILVVHGPNLNLLGSRGYDAALEYALEVRPGARLIARAST